MPGYAPSDEQEDEQENEQRRNAYVHRRRWWWIRGAHQREPIRSCSLTSSTQNGGGQGERVGGGKESSEGDGRESGRERKRERARGINVARASTTNHSPSDLETLSELFLVSSGCFAVPERTPCYQPPRREDHPRSTVCRSPASSRHSRRDPRLVKKRSRRLRRDPEDRRDQCYRGYTAKDNRTEGPLISKMTIVSIFHE